MDDNMVLINEDNLYDIANAIRRKNGDTVKYLPEEMAPAIDAIPTSEDSNLAGNLAIAYDGLSFPVQVGTHCIYDSNYYICTVAIDSAEPFTRGHWARITAGVEIQSLVAELPNKVDKVEGKGLSTNDYTDSDKTALTNIITALGDSQIRKLYTSTDIMANGTIVDELPIFTIYGICQQDGTPTPDNPVDINIVGSNGVILIVCNNTSIYLPVSSGLCGIPVTSGGNFIDPDGQAWVCDTIDKVRNKYIQRVDVRTFSGPGASFSANNRYIIQGISTNPIADTAYTGQLCNRFRFVTSLSTVTSTEGTFKVHVTGSGGTNMYMHAPSGVTDATTAQAWLASNPVTVMFPLATPVEYDLTEAQINALNALISGETSTRIYVSDTPVPYIKTAIFVNIDV